MTFSARLLTTLTATGLTIALSGCQLLNTGVSETPAPNTTVTAPATPDDTNTPAPEVAPLVQPVAPQDFPNSVAEPVHTVFSAEEIATFEQLVSEHRNAVVSVFTQEGSSGTGFLVENDIVITNHHVVESFSGGEPTGISVVTIDGRTIAGEHIVSDSMVDVAVIRLAEPAVGVSPLAWASEPAQVGDPVFYIGHPSGYGSWFAGVGVVSETQYGLVLSTLPISSGASGSPMLNTQGEVVAVISGQFDVGAPGVIEPAPAEVRVHETLPATTMDNAGGSSTQEALSVIQGAY